ncbi:MAG: glycosyltransferase [Rickettsiales bacterium]|jgi:alpha-1,3-rhamnosyl/mannosyltransferase|nr:glycosyltransferase [Rickettsiales bacterium]
MSKKKIIVSLFGLIFFKLLKIKIQPSKISCLLFSFVPLCIIRKKNNSYQFRLLGFIPFFKITSITNSYERKDDEKKDEETDNIETIITKRILLERRYETFENNGKIIEDNKIRILFDGISLQYSWERGIGFYAYGLFCGLKENTDYQITLLFDKNDKKLWQNNLIKDVPYIFTDELENFIDKPFDFFMSGDIYCTQTTKKYHIPKSLFYQSIGVVHDIIPTLFPSEPECQWSQRRNISGIKSILQTDHILANSFQTKYDIVKFVGVSPKKISVIYGGPNEMLTATLAEVSNINTVTNNLVSILDNSSRKNYIKTTEAFVLAYKTGKIPHDSRFVIACKLSDDIIHKIMEIVPKELQNIVVTSTEFIPQIELVKLLKQARATIYASLYEGLGMPVLESYVVGTPCITANASSTRELAPPECLVNPSDVNEIAEKIIAIYNDEELREKSLSFGKKLLIEKCNWNTVAEKVDKILKDMKSARESTWKELINE